MRLFLLEVEGGGGGGVGVHNKVCYETDWATLSG